VFQFLLKAGVEVSIVNAPWITDQLFKSNLTFCVVCVFILQPDELCVHNRLFNANFEHPILKKDKGIKHFRVNGNIVS
jgi:hypothetical protein